jgi:hypothetical protein
MLILGRWNRIAPSTLPVTFSCSNVPVHQNLFTASQVISSGLPYPNAANLDTSINVAVSYQPYPPPLHDSYGANWNTSPLVEAVGFDQSISGNGSSASIDASTSILSNKRLQTPQPNIWQGEVKQMMVQQNAIPYIQPCLETQQQMVSSQHKFSFVQPCPEPARTHDQLLPPVFHPCDTASESIVSIKNAQPHDQNQASLATKTPGWKCDIPGCSSTTDFTRISDLRRHQKKHKASPIPCTAIGCDRRRKKPIFRQDKFREHVLTNHGDASLFKCPNRSCSIASLPFRHLQIHFDLDCKESPDKRKARENWGSLLKPTARICPLPRCRKITNASWEERHILHEHNDQERNEQSSLLTRAGYDPETCHRLCPICGKTASHPAGFGQHLIDVHEIIDKDHCLAWLDSIKKHFRDGGNTGKLTGRESFTLISIFEGVKSGYNCFFPETVSSAMFDCPSCMFRTVNSEVRIFDQEWNQIVAQHKGLFVKSPELYEHRDAILRLFPSFRMHSIFEDIRFQEQSSQKLNQGMSKVLCIRESEANKID